VRRDCVLRIRCSKFTLERWRKFLFRHHEFRRAEDALNYLLDIIDAIDVVKAREVRMESY